MQTSSSPVGRLGAVAAVLGGALWSAKASYDRNDAPPWPTDITDTLFFVVPLLLAAGFVGLHARCKGRLDGEWEPFSLGSFLVGAAGFVVSAAGLLAVTLEVGPAWAMEISWWSFVFGFFMGNLGLAFFGVSVLQGGALGRWKPLPLALGVLGILLIPLGDAPNSDLGFYPSLALWVLYGLGWAAIGGFALVEDRGRGESPARREPETNV